MAIFAYALPDHTTLQQEAAVARGLRRLFPEIEFERQESGHLFGDILPIAGRLGDSSKILEPSRLLVCEVRTAFAGLLIDTLAST